MEDELKKLHQVEINKLVINKWYFYEQPWSSLPKKYNHRTNLKFIKDVLKDHLGYIPVFYFLKCIIWNS
jgi:hypothetical protein